MDSNQLLHYLRGFFELVDEPTPAQIRAIRNEILRATTVGSSPTPGPPAPTGDCGCGPPRAGRTPAPVLDPSKI